MSLGTPRVTVAMITYNHERYVAEAISSILGQTYRDFELVIVDDGSTDRTREVIHGFRDERIRYVRQENQGPSAARNTALREAHGDVIAQMSGDDVAEPNRLARQVDVLDERKDRVVFTDIVLIDEDGHPRNDTLDSAESASARMYAGFTASLRRMANRPRTEILRYLFTEGNCFSAPTAFAAREVFESVGGYDVLMLQVQDWDMWIRLLLNGVVPQTVPEPLLRYRIRAAHANLSAPTDATIARVFFEVKRMLRAYRGISSVAELRSIFPEVDRLHYPLENEFTLFYLALLAIRNGNEGGNRLTGFFGGDLLLELMADAGFRARIGERLGFRLPDLFRILGTTDPRSRRDIEAAVEAFTRSRSWRLTRPLRTLSAFAARLRIRAVS
jgi:glycosyltransferase involved in cell wall biosynthesis